MEIEAAIKVLQELGLMDAFSGILSFFVFLVLIKKYFFNGSVSFLKSFLTSFLDQRDQTLTVQIQIKEKLEDLAHDFNQMTMSFFDQKNIYQDLHRDMQSGFERLDTWNQMISEHVNSIHRHCEVARKNSERIETK